MIFLDTNTCIYILKGDFPGVAENLRKHSPATICVPSIVKAELLYGACKCRAPGETRRQVCKFLLPFDVVPFDDEATGLYGNIRADLEKQGQPIGPNELVIAASVLSRSGKLVTHNISEFSRVDGLKIEDWCED